MSKRFRLLAAGLAAVFTPLVTAQVRELPADAADIGLSRHGDPQAWQTAARVADVVTIGPGPAGTLPPPARALAVEFLDPSSNAEGDAPSGMAFTPDGARFVICNRDSRNVNVYDAATRAVLANVDVSGSPGGIAISSDGVHAVTANLWEDTASIIDLNTYNEIATVPVGAQPGVVRISPDGTLAVVGNTVDGSLSVIDIATATELRRISGAGFSSSLSVNFEPGTIALAFTNFEFAGNNTIVHPNYFGDQVSFYDVNTGAANDVPTLTRPRFVAITPDAGKAVLSHTFPGTSITVLDPNSQTVAKTINLGVDLWGPISIRPNGVKAAVAVQNAVRIVNLNTDAVSPAINTASVNQLVTSSTGAYALGVGFNGSLIDYATNQLLTNLNQLVSTSFGAASPTGQRAGMVAQTFGEDLLVVNTNGAAGFAEYFDTSGPPPEADAPRTVAISPDGSTAVVVNLLSDSASVINLNTRTVLGVVAVGDRPAEVEITPDGTQAVVANLDSTFASVINLNTLAVTSVPISRRASEVEIAPDGSYAYLAVVADGDGVWRIDLDTLTTVGGKLLTGDMGSVGFLHQQSSGMTLSPDGGTLVTCNSFANTASGAADRISIVDTATWTELTEVTVGDLPARATFSPDGSTIFVSNRNSDTITVVSNAGAASAAIATIPVGDQPFEMAVDPNAATLYVLNYGDPTVGVVDLNTNTMTASIPLPNAPAGLHLDGDRLHVATGTWSVTLGPGPLTAITRAGEFTTIDTQTLAIDEQIATGHPAADLRVRGTLAVAPSPFDGGVLLIDLADACPGDVDGNNTVDLSDLAILLANFGNPAATREQGDLTGDGTVDLSDLAELLSNFGGSCS